MPTKYLKVANATEAKQKSIAVKNTRWPNWFDDQMQKHLAQPNVCPHPSRYVEDPMHGWKEDPQTGECELHIPDDEVGLYDQDDQGAMTDVAQIEDEQ